MMPVFPIGAVVETPCGRGVVERISWRGVWRYDVRGQWVDARFPENDLRLTSSLRFCSVLQSVAT